MLLVITGDGKGKTTSSLGMVIRAKGQGLRCAVMQFIKNNPSATGEYKSFSQLGIDWENWGEGFTWQQYSMEPTKQDCLKGWESFKQKAESGNYDFIVMDEFTYVLQFGLLDEQTVLDYLKQAKEKVHIVITGRGASEKLTELADTVSEVKEIKHHYRTNGGFAVKGIEF